MYLKRKSGSIKVWRQKRCHISLFLAVFLVLQLMTPVFRVNAAGEDSGTGVVANAGGGGVKDSGILDSGVTGTTYGDARSTVDWRTYASFQMIGVEDAGTEIPLIESLSPPVNKQIPVYQYIKNGVKMDIQIDFTNLSGNPTDMDQQYLLQLPAGDGKPFRCTESTQPMVSDTVQFGTAAVGQNGEMTVALEQSLGSFSNIKGNAKFSFALDKQQIEHDFYQNGVRDIKVTLDNVEYTLVLVDPQTPGTPTIVKGDAQQPDTENLVKWSFTVDPNKSPLATGSDRVITVTDTLDTYQTFSDLAIAKKIYVSYADAPGAAIEIKNKQDAAATAPYYERSANQKELLFTLLDTQSAKKQTITYYAEITEDAMTNQQGKQPQNTVTLTIPGQSPVSDTGKTTIPTWIGKAKGSRDSATTGTDKDILVAWKVTVNKDGLSIPENTILEDPLPQGLLLVKVAHESGGSPDNWEVPEGDVSAGASHQNMTYQKSSATAPGGTFQYTFTSADSLTATHTFNLVAKVIPAELGNGWGNAVFENTANLKIPNGTGGYKAYPSGTVGVENNVKDQLITKCSIEEYGTGGGYDTINHTVLWEIVVNQSERTVTNALVHDKIPEGQAYVDGSFFITPPPADNGLAGIFNETGDEWTYDFGGTIANRYVIRYETQITSPEMIYNKPQGNAQKPTFRNSVDLKEDGNVLATATAARPVASSVVRKEASAYFPAVDANNNTEIEWKVTINADQTALSGAVFQDELEKGLSYVPGSFQLERRTEKTQRLYDAATGQVSAPVTVAAKDAFDVTGAQLTASPNPVAPNQRQMLSYTFPASISDCYVLTFRTKVDASIMKEEGTTAIKNTARLATMDGHEYSSETQTATIKNKPITKVGTPNNGKGHIDWVVDANNNALAVESLAIEDVLPSGLVLDLERNPPQLTSYRLKNTASNVAAPQKDPASAVTIPLALGQNLFYEEVPGDSGMHRLRVDVPMEKSDPRMLTLTYRTYVGLTGNRTFTNNVSLGGQGGISGSAASSISTSVTSIDTDITGERGSIQLKKVDEHNQPLANIPFLLYETAVPGATEGGRLVSALTTKADGFSEKVINLRLGWYYIVEKEAPEGYWLCEPISIQLPDTGGSRDVVITVPNAPNKVTVEKKDEEDVPLSGAKFGLFDAVADTKVMELTETAAGTYLCEKVPEGTYYVKELLPPDGYSSTEWKTPPLTFSRTVVPDPSAYTFVCVNQPNEIRFVKVGEAANFTGKQPVKDAAFGLFTQSGIPVAGMPQAVTDAQGQGRFTNVKDGTYTIRELSAAGYPATWSKQITVKRGENYDLGEIVNHADGRLTITKTGTDIEGTDLPRQGVRFDLYQKGAQADRWIAWRETDADGQCVFDRLLYGEYYIKETKAPDGYPLDAAKTYGFSVSQSKPAETLSVSNTAAGSLRVEKTDPSGQEKLRGAKIGLFNGAGKKISEALTDENGVCYFRNVPYAAYTVKELSAPDGYQFDAAQAAEVVLAQDAPDKSVTLINQVNRVLCEKVQKNTPSQKLKDAVFGLYRTDDTEVATAVSEEDGTFYFEKIPFGDYYIKEITPPPGYQRSDEQYAFTLSGTSEALPVKQFENARVISGGGGGTGDKGSIIHAADGQKITSGIDAAKETPKKEITSGQNADGTLAAEQDYPAPDGMQLAETVQTVQMNRDEISRLLDSGYVPLAVIPANLTRQQLLEWIDEEQIPLGKYIPSTGDYPAAPAAALLFVSVLGILALRRRRK